jgi:hypothetical protein
MFASEFKINYYDKFRGSVKGIFLISDGDDHFVSILPTSAFIFVLICLLFMVYVTVDVTSSDCIGLWESAISE